jgi:hypothetical protein
MKIIKTAHWVASVGSRFAIDTTRWALLKIEKMGESHLCSTLYDNTRDAATMDSLFNKMSLAENQEHIHHDNETV